MASIKTTKRSLRRRIYFVSTALALTLTTTAFVATSQDTAMSALIDSARTSHWAFQPVTKPTRSEVDEYIVARLEQKGLVPSPIADRRTLLRRAYYDLIGLPPTFDDLTEFANDPSPDAFEKVVDRLLASPQYGERWGRHWLDIARYSDTKGQDAQYDQTFPFSYTYRDYVIRAFNEDLPYDEFIVQQLAADQLDLGKDKRPLAALGFLTLGKQFGGDIHATLDDQIDVVTRGMLGLTVSCARCHDHKHDPIPSQDYYSLYGIFRSARAPDELPIIEMPDSSSESYQAYKKELEKLESALQSLAEVETPVDGAESAKMAARRQAIQKHKYTHPGRPHRAMALENRPNPFESYVFIRGDSASKGPAAPRRFLDVLSDEDRTPFASDQDRLALAKKIASPDNPLTARVFVNRVWMHHFGQPLVDTPSDFGLRGEKPTHPALLDYLAWRFMEDGWSIKSLHRLIMLSATYRQSSLDTEANQKNDPDNRLYWRQNRRRLDFEAMRDSLLKVASNLDLTMGGQSISITKQPFTHRRTVYAEIDRQYLPTLFGTFDFATPNSHRAKRFLTTVPQQALFVMNSPFVAEQAKLLAKHKREISPTSDSERVRDLYRNVFLRDPNPRELDLGVAFVRTRDTEKIAAPEVDPPTWLYGYGVVDEENERVASFSEFPHWDGEAYQGAEKLPAPDLGFAHLERYGGHPGDSNHAVVRRWISPVDSTLSFVGELHHYSSVGDGITGYVISSREGILWQGEVQDGMIPTVFHDSAIRKGDTVDLVIACNENDKDDRFKWHPRLYLAAEDATKYPKQDWLTRFDFAPPPPKAPAPLEPWEQYAQVLLMSNEFMFVD